jgi:non-structural maintenance of chromosomes element 1
MFETNNTYRREVMAIQPIEATRLHKPPNRRESENAETQGSSGSGISQTQAEKVLKTLVQQGWFEKSRKNYYSLSPRALMELRSWLIETYNDDDDEGDGHRSLKIKQCYACKEIVTVVSSLTSLRVDLS